MRGKGEGKADSEDEVRGEGEGVSGARGKMKGRSCLVSVRVGNGYAKH